MQDISIRTAVAIQNLLARMRGRGGGPDRRRVRRHPGPHRGRSSPPSSSPTSTARSRTPSARRSTRSSRGSSRIQGPPAFRSIQSVPGLRPGALCCVLALFAALALAAPAAAQDDPAATEDRSVLVILDGSDSMNEDAGDGGTRLDAAKAALGELIDAVPEGAKVGLRVYGNELSGVSRAEGCRDTNLVTPVGPLDRDGVQGRGRRAGGQGPHADRPLAAEGARRPRPERRPHGHPGLRRRRQLRAAGAVQRGRGRSPSAGVKLSISVVGLQVNDRVRRQLECIADAGGGTYVDAEDPDALRARAAGGVRARLPRLRPGRHAGAGHARAGLGADDRRGPVPGLDPAGGDQALRGRRQARPEAVRLRGRRPAARDGRRRRVLRAADHAAGRAARTSRATCSTGTTTGSTATSSTSACAASRWRRRGSRARSSRAAGSCSCELEAGDLDPEAIPVELGIQVLDPNEKAGQATEPGQGGDAGAVGDRDAQREPGGAAATTAAAPASRSSSPAWPGC